MLVKELTKKIELDYPLSYALEWDNVGFLIGRAEKEIKKIYIALDATEDVFKEAVSYGADMLLTHHPLIMRPITSVTNEYFNTKRILDLLQMDMAYYAMHTNYDVLRMGKLASKILGLVDSKALEQLEGAPDAVGIGEIGELISAISLEDCVVMVKEKFQLEKVKIFGDLTGKVRRIAVVPGSGKSTIETAIKQEADVLITGDVGHHDGIDAVAQGMAIVDAGHYGLEHIFLADIKTYLTERFSDIEVCSHPIAHPFAIV